MRESCSHVTDVVYIQEGKGKPPPLQAAVFVCYLDCHGSLQDGKRQCNWHCLTDTSRGGSHPSHGSFISGSGGSQNRRTWPSTLGVQTAETRMVSAYSTLSTLASR